MTIVFIVLLAISVLFFWLRGGWFARVLAFLALAPALVMTALCIPATHASAVTEAASIIGGGVLAWIVAAIPAKLATHRMRAPAILPPGTSITLR